jgi:adenylate cyclase
VSELFVVNGICGGTVFFLPDVPTVLGRSAECQVQIADPWISSMHAMFEKRGAELWLVDLESRNGTWVNEQKVREAPLAPGYRLRFGKTEVELRQGLTPRPLQHLTSENGTIVRYLADMQAEERAAREPESALARRDTDPSSRRTTDRGPWVRRQVAMVNDIGRAVVDAPDLDTALARVLHTVAAAVRAERSTLLLMDESGHMQPRATEPPGSPPRISETVVTAAAKGRAGLLTIDAQQDLRFAGSKSIVAQGIRSCLCVPVWADNRILGMVVMDRGFVDPFTADDLELTTLVGYQTALVIERARFLAGTAAAEEERLRLARHFSPDVSTLVVAQEQAGHAPLAPQARDDVTVLFVDVQGFSGLAERLHPPELAALLDDFFRQVAESIFEEQGTLDKLVADGVMAVFGAPVHMADGATRALRCAWRMLERVEQTNLTLPADRRYAIRIGVNTGSVVAGTFGPPGRAEYTVLGDTVSAAARIEAMAAPGSIYVGRETARQAAGSFAFQDLGRRVPRGVSPPVDVLRVTGPTGAA